MVTGKGFALRLGLKRDEPEGLETPQVRRQDPRPCLCEGKWGGLLHETPKEWGHLRGRAQNCSG
jgi:hypothetical protein